MPDTDRRVSSSTLRRGLVPLDEERLERRLAMAFALMSFIPILILVWAMVYDIELSMVIYLVTGSALTGYFLIARRMIRSVVNVTQKVHALSSGKHAGLIDITERNEIGELARSFN